MSFRFFGSLPGKMLYALKNPDYFWRRLSDPVYAATNYDPQQWSRVVMYCKLSAEVENLQPEKLSVLEISPGGAASFWKKFGFLEYNSTQFPDFDICAETTGRQYDLIIADQVFEHLLWPHRAAKNVFAMLKPGGHFINTTPFLIRIHANPTDCSRWTEIGMKYFLADCGFDLTKIRTGAWGNLACVRANLTAPRWASLGWGRSMQNEPDFPVTVWAIAQK